MNSRPPDVDRPGSAAAQPGRESDHLGRRIEVKDSPATPIAQRPFAVVIRGTRRREWGRYATSIQADDQARALQKHGFDARAETAEQPEHNGDRRRFLVWAVLGGFAKPERLTERIVAEVESEAAP